MDSAENTDFPSSVSFENSLEAAALVVSDVWTHKMRMPPWKFFLVSSFCSLKAKILSHCLFVFCFVLFLFTLDMVTTSEAFFLAKRACAASALDQDLKKCQQSLLSLYGKLLHSGRMIHVQQLQGRRHCHPAGLHLLCDVLNPDHEGLVSSKLSRLKGSRKREGEVNF